MPRTASTKSARTSKLKRMPGENRKGMVRYLDEIKEYTIPTVLDGYVAKFIRKVHSNSALVEYLKKTNQEEITTLIFYLRPSDCAESKASLDFMIESPEREIERILPREIRDAGALRFPKSFYNSKDQFENLVQATVYNLLEAVTEYRRKRKPLHRVC